MDEEVKTFDNCIDNPFYTESNSEITGPARMELERVVLDILRQSRSYTGDPFGDSLPAMVKPMDTKRKRIEEGNIPSGKREFIQ